MTTSAPQHPKAFPLSEKVKVEVNKKDVWTVFSPASGYVPKVILTRYIETRRPL